MIFTENELPELTGSEKQVVWATKIRTSSVEQWNNLVERQQRRAVDTPELLAAKDAISWLAEDAEASRELLATTVFNQTAARFWIDNREVNFVGKVGGNLSEQRILAKRKAAAQ